MINRTRETNAFDMWADKFIYPEQPAPQPVQKRSWNTLGVLLAIAVVAAALLPVVSLFL